MSGNGRADPGAGANYPPTFEQTGSFETRPDEEGHVYYPFAKGIGATETRR